MNLQYRHFYAALDACKVADYVLFVLSPTVEVDSWGELLLRTVQAQGLPTVVSCIVAPTDTTQAVDSKSRPAILKSLTSFMQYFVPSQNRVFDLTGSNGGDRVNALRALCEGRPAEVRWRESRTWMLAESVRWDDGILDVTGFVRGNPFSVNRLVHLPNFGDFQVDKVSSRF